MDGVMGLVNGEDRVLWMELCDGHHFGAHHPSQSGITCLIHHQYLYILGAFFF